MSKPKKKPAVKAKAKLKDLGAKKNPKGGNFQFPRIRNGGLMLNPQPLPP